MAITPKKSIPTIPHMPTFGFIQGKGKGGGGGKGGKGPPGGPGPPGGGGVGGGGSFNPGMITNDILWLAADTGVFTDESGTTPAVNDGDTIGHWHSISTSPNHNGTQATEAARPELKLNILNGKPILRFAGAQYLLLPDLAIVNGDYTIFILAKGGTTGTMLSCGNSNIALPNPLLNCFHIDGGNRRLNHRDDAGTELAAGTFDVAAADDAWHLSTYRRNGTDFLNRVDLGVATGSQTQTLLTTSCDRGAVGATSGSTGFTVLLTGDIAEIVVYSDNLSDTDRGRVEQYFNSKYSLGL